MQEQKKNSNKENKMKTIKEIKKQALENHIPIIMDDTLEVINNALKNMKISKILEIGTAVRIFCYLLYTKFRRKWYFRYNRKR